MSIGRDDRWLADAQGRALAGAQVYWCSQPATVPDTPPPSPLMTVYTDLSGTVALPQPVLTDGFGHAAAYLPQGVFFTVVMYHPLFGEFPVIVRDQLIGGGGGGGGSTVTAFSGTPIGTINGSNRVFTVANGLSPLVVSSLPTQITVVLNMPLVQGAGYSLALVGTSLQITYANAPQPASGSTPADVIWAQGLYIS